MPAQQSHSRRHARRHFPRLVSGELLRRRIAHRPRLAANLRADFREVRLHEQGCPLHGRQLLAPQERASGQRRRASHIASGRGRQGTRTAGCHSRHHKQCRRPHDAPHDTRRFAARDTQGSRLDPPAHRNRACRRRRIQRLLRLRIRRGHIQVPAPCVDVVRARERQQTFVLLLPPAQGGQDTPRDECRRR